MLSAEYLLDSDVIIWHLRGNEQVGNLLAELEEFQPVACSVINVFEVVCGARPQERELTMSFLNSLWQIPVTPEIATEAGEYWKNFRRRGITLGRSDALIAATAKVRELTLVTFNIAHYPMKDIELYEPMPKIR